MLKRYSAYIVLLLAGLLLYFVLHHQRGPARPSEHIAVTTDAVTTADEGFSRHPRSLIYTKHSRCRMDCRHITEAEVKEILETGKVNERKIEEDERGKTYPLEGKTNAGKMVRIVVAPKREDLVIVTVIDLDNDWPCGDCR